MMEKLSSLCVRFMPTFVSPATSIRSGPPTVARSSQGRRHRVNRSTKAASGRAGAAGTRPGPSRRGFQRHRDLAELLAGIHEELYRVARRVLPDEVRELLGRIDGVAVDGDDQV